MIPNSIAVYVHVPFCPTKCGYCDFNSYAMEGEIMERTTNAMVKEILSSPWRGIPAKTVFFGGGTPTFIPAEQLRRLLEAVLQVHPVEGKALGVGRLALESEIETVVFGPSTGERLIADQKAQRQKPSASASDVEITSEANPGTVDAEKFATMRKAGFNRISLGAQSFNAEDLITLGRIHRPDHIGRAVSAAREAGFDNINVDLMFALPGQSQRGWQQNLERALALETEHLSLYGLTIEQNTPFYKQHLKGQLILPEDDDQVAMYELALRMAEDRGIHQYEISNFAKPGRECLHNLCYWHGEYYAAYGPGAVGFMPTNPLSHQYRNTATPHHASPRRYTNLKHPEGYCTAVEQGLPAFYEEELLSARDVRFERIMLGLRLNEGLNPSSLDLDEASLDGLRQRGWIETDSEIVRLSPAGKHFCTEATLALV